MFVHRLKMIGLFVFLFMAVQVCHVVATLRIVFFAIFGSDDKMKKTFVLYDYLGNFVTGGTFMELLSTRAARAMDNRERWGCVLCKLLDKFDKGHCDKYRKP